MLQVTPAAKRIFTDALRAERSESGLLIRLHPAENDPQQLEFDLDVVHADDCVIPDVKGRRILAMQPEVAGQLEYSVLDFQDTPEGAALVLLDQECGAAED